MATITTYKPRRTADTATTATTETATFPTVLRAFVDSSVRVCGFTVYWTFSKNISVSIWGLVGFPRRSGSVRLNKMAFRTRCWWRLAKIEFDDTKGQRELQYIYLFVNGSFCLSLYFCFVLFFAVWDKHFFFFSKYKYFTLFFKYTFSKFCYVFSCKLLVFLLCLSSRPS